MKTTILKTTLGAIALACSGLAMADVTFYEYENYAGRSYTARDAVADFQHNGFNDRAQSLRVEGGTWMFCSDANLQGQCRTFTPGSYAELPGALNNRLSSGRRVG